MRCGKTKLFAVLHLLIKRAIALARNAPHKQPTKANNNVTRIENHTYVYHIGRVVIYIKEWKII